MNKYPFPSVIDSSMMGSLKSCPQLFYKQYIANWKAKELSVHLHAGGAFAKGIEVAREVFFVRNESAEDAIAEGLSALLKAYGDFACPADSAKSAERMAGAFEFYFSNYPLERDNCAPIILPSGKHGIEFSFVEPLPIAHPETGDPILYSGRMDAILNFAGGVFIFDEKTTTSLGATWSRQWDLRSQFTGYCWGAERAGIKVDGAVVRGVSILKTKYDTQEAISYRPEWQVERWLADTLSWIEIAIEMWKKDRWLFNLDHACTEYGGCAFRQACLSQDEKPWLETYFERRFWNPITREETLL
jgi:hypothetical protein